ncbi:hypothetical protein FA893_11440, partial [Photobacterium damselae subsp. piscicida]
MEIVRNSVWQFKSSEILDDGLYRVLEVLDAADCVILFPLSQTTTTIRPVGISIEGFIQQSKRRKIQRSEYKVVTPIDLLMVKFTFYKRSNNLIVHLFAF